MSVLNYLQSKKLFIAIQIIVSTYIGILLSLYNVPVDGVLFIIIVLLLASIVYLLSDFLHRRGFYVNLKRIVKNLEEKVYTTDMLDEPEFIEGKIFYKMIGELTKYMRNEISRYKLNEHDYKEYIETWVHEIKIPIACLELLCENNKSTLANDVLVQTKKIYALVEQSLFYGKTDYLESDFVIRQCDINEIVNTCLKNYSIELIKMKAEIKKNDSSVIASTDKKWFEYILMQIIANSIKYCSTRPLVLEFFIEKNQTNVVLTIKDNGIGISKRDLPRVFERGFSGENAHFGYKSTGIGLYLVKKMSEKIDVSVEIDSVKDSYTVVKLVLPFYHM